MLFRSAHGLGRNESAGAQAITTVAKLVVLAGMALVGFLSGGGDWGHFHRGGWPGQGEWPALAGSLIYVGYAYAGWNAAAYLAGEMRDPARMVPRALVGGCLLVGALYLALNVLYIYAIDPAAFADMPMGDVGRVAEFGSVRLKDVLTVERYSHVMHLCSTVTGQVRQELTALEALRACLPAGTLSGAPKVRAMEIIDELEPVKRGPYGGAVGYVDFSGNMDTCIALRTLVLKDGVAHVQAGAGVVADSVPESEWQETLNKARGLLRALQLARSLSS